MSIFSRFLFLINFLVQHMCQRTIVPKIIRCILNFAHIIYDFVNLILLDETISRHRQHSILLFLTGDVTVERRILLLKQHLLFLLYYWLQSLGSCGSINCALTAGLVVENGSHKFYLLFKQKHFLLQLFIYMTYIR